MAITAKASAAQLETEKQAAARAAVSWVRPGMTLGLGTGTTASYFIRFLGERVCGESLEIEAVASSVASERLAASAGIRVIAPRRGLRLDLTVDGADEIDSSLNLVKGRGGALLREKVLARVSRYFLVIADSSKRVERLGIRPLPVEVVPFAAPWVADAIEMLGAKTSLMSNPARPSEPFVTDQGNQILECVFDGIEYPHDLGGKIEDIPGVVGHGLFVGFAQAAVVASGSDVWVLRRGQAPVKFNEPARPVGA